MNILIFSWRGPGHPHAGGAEKVTHEYAKGWVKAGHKVTLFTSDYTGCKPLEIIDEVLIIRRGSQILKVHLHAFLWYINGRREKFDLVIDQFHGIPFFTPLFVGVKKLAFIHEVTKEIWRLNPLPMPFNLIPTIFGTFCEPFIFRLLYKNIPFMTGSDSTKKDLINWGIPEDCINIIPYGLEKSPLEKIPSKETKKTFIFLGALARDKGIEEALKAFALINSKIANLEFWVVGKGEKQYTKYLKIKSKELGLEKNMKFWGYVDNKLKYLLLAKAHLLINPSFREGWSLVVMEAASVGTPTVGFDVPGLRDSIINGKTGILSSKDPVNLASKVLELMKDNDKYEILSKNCLNWAKRFSWKKSVNLSLKLIDNLVNI